MLIQKIVTLRGFAVDPMDPDPTQFDIHDIARALSHEPRYNGHTLWHYSVAQHCLLLSHIVDHLGPAIALAALLHDATEAYMKDLPSPLKIRPEFAFYCEAENKLLASIYQCFGVPFTELPEVVHDYDQRIRSNEIHVLGWADHPRRDAHGPMLAEISIEKLSPEEVSHAFLNRFVQLTMQLAT